MADLNDAQSALTVKLVGANPSSGIEDNFADVDTSGRLTIKLNDGAGSSVNLGQNTMANSLPVVIASNQSSIPISGTVTANQGTPNTAANGWFEKITDGIDTAKVTTNQDLSTSDGLRNGGTQGAITLTTANTAYEAKVGISRLSNRKSLIITANDDMYWGYNNTVTVSTGQKLAKDQQIAFAIDSDSTFQIWLVSAANSKTARIAESP